jgi:hypothetical protein
MEAKEKAAELVNRYRMILMDEDTDCGNEILCSLIAIKNSHIAVDEILEFMDKFNIDMEYKHQAKWWRKVKFELDVM